MRFSGAEIFSSGNACIEGTYITRDFFGSVHLKSCRVMPSVSKQKRLAEKAAKKSAAMSTGDSSTTRSTPTGSLYSGSAISTPITSLSAANSTDDLMSMAKLRVATDRCVPFHTSLVPFFNHHGRSAAGVLVSDVKSRDIKIDSFTLSFHGRLLIEGAEVAFNYGQRYGLLGQNGSGKVRWSFTSSGHINKSRSLHFFNPSLNGISKFHRTLISTS
jgi:hypothetical protein